MPLQALEALSGGQAPSAEEVQRHFMFATGQIHKQWRRVADKLLTPRGHALVMAGAILSILLNPLLFKLALRRSGQAAAAPAAL